MELATFQFILFTRAILWLMSGNNLVVVLEYTFFQLCSNTEQIS